MLRSSSSRWLGRFRSFTVSSSFRILRGRVPVAVEHQIKITPPRYPTHIERCLADAPEMTESFQLSWSFRYSSRRQFSLFSSDSCLLPDSPAGSLSVLDVRERRPSSRRFREERASFV
ncbi:hypothetical protein EYF80_011174 [Liparis tanakae]|uniref:Uncharacterized protein n=1 Tax=Liparis tanakae TaxID=230148 RepID=A0A4Z2IKN9_9TELE|nr:hypothetical protein EYF80_011174 [Liparis tanakae]